MINNNLSANTLFHFTNSMDNIISILENNFYPRLCMESQNYVLPEGYICQVAIPMVCFCDIPLSQIRNHISNYGGYAIGLSKEWARKNRINPVMYTLPDSHPVNTIKASLEIACSFWDESDKENDRESKAKYFEQIDNIGIKVYELVKYLKPYEGNPWKDNKFQDEITRFYDEREWRYIPNEKVFNEEDFQRDYLTKEEYLNVNLRDEYNKKMENLCRLKFEPNDIRYIIVKEEHELLDIEEKITRIKGSKYTYDELRLLKTRIISMSQVLSDF